MRVDLGFLLDKARAMSPRERLMAVGALLAAVVYLGDSLLITPERERTLALEQQLAAQADQLRLLQSAIARIKTTRSPEALAAERLRRDELESEVKFAREMLDLGRQSVHVGAMARAVIAQSHGLSLRSLTVNAPQVFHLPKAVQPGAARSPAAAPAAPASASLPTLYLHGVTVSVDGTYAQLLQFLHRLETGPNRLFWPEVVLHVNQYPQVNLRATIQTLSIREDAPLE